MPSPTGWTWDTYFKQQETRLPLLNGALIMAQYNAFRQIGTQPWSTIVCAIICAYYFPDDDDDYDLDGISYLLSISIQNGWLDAQAVDLVHKTFDGWGMAAQPLQDLLEEIVNEQFPTMQEWIDFFILNDVFE